MCVFSEDFVNVQKLTMQWYMADLSETIQAYYVACPPLTAVTPGSTTSFLLLAADIVSGRVLQIVLCICFFYNEMISTNESAFDWKQGKLNSIRGSFKKIFFLFFLLMIRFKGRLQQQHQRPTNQSPAVWSNYWNTWTSSPFQMEYCTRTRETWTKSSSNKLYLILWSGKFSMDSVIQLVTKGRSRTLSLARRRLFQTGIGGWHCESCELPSMHCWKDSRAHLSRWWTDPVTSVP